MQGRPTQQTIDFDRGERLGLVDDCPVASGVIVEGNAATPVQVSGRIAKSVLRAIESFCRDRSLCWASEQTIAEKIGATSRTVRRAIMLLEDRQLVVATRRPGRSTQVAINWGEVSSIVRGSTTSADPGKSDTNPGKSDMNPGKSYRRTVTKRNETLPPSPPNASDRVGTWDDVGRCLAAAGVREWAKALDCLKRTVDVGHASQIVDVWNQRAGAYRSPFVLYRRCRNANAALPPDDGWPDPDPDSDYARQLQQADAIRESTIREAKAWEMRTGKRLPPEAIDEITQQRLLESIGN